MELEDEERTVQLILADIVATIGPGYEFIVRANAQRVRQHTQGPEDDFRRVVEGTQQDLHDRFIDTDWPKCPLHNGRHPLWLGDGGWWCEQERVLLAPVGQLVSKLGL